jgi:hypothetical protein
MNSKTDKSGVLCFLIIFFASSAFILTVYASPPTKCKWDIWPTSWEDSNGDCFHSDTIQQRCVEATDPSLTCNTDGDHGDGQHDIWEVPNCDYSTGFYGWIHKGTTYPPHLCSI